MQMQMPGGAPMGHGADMGQTGHMGEIGPYWLPLLLLSPAAGA